MSSRDQQAAFLETIAALKNALKRKAYDSDSDDIIDATSNRGNKLRKRARYVRRGKLGPPTGPSVYRHIIEHAGYHRTIISENPPLVDEDGYDVESDDDEQRIQDAVAAAAEINPYSNVPIERILAPLTAVSELPNHPTLSQPFTSKALTELVTQGSDLLHKENAALWHVRPLLTRLCGDSTWVSCGSMVAPDDLDFFQSKKALSIPDPSVLEAASTIDDLPGIEGENTAPTSSVRLELGDGPRRRGADEMTDVAADPDAMNVDTDGIDVDVKPPPAMADTKIGGFDSAKKRQASTKPNAEVDKNSVPDTPAADTNSVQDNVRETRASSRQDLASHRPLSPAPSIESERLINPIFLAPFSARPDRNLHLPEPEADDVRRLLQLYVQKQEEVCRGTRKLHEGLMRADRLRKTVLKWAKAEGHIGPDDHLSDGEDWYDKEEWGLVDDLKKGQDEEEEDTTVQTQKKTRNRRGQ